jgi:hypothetical protein
MKRGTSICAVAVMLGSYFAGDLAVLAQEKKYPTNFDSTWRNPRAGQRGNPWDITKPMGLGQGAPLTPEYQAIFEAQLKRQKEGGQGRSRGTSCELSGMPKVMSLSGPMDMIVRKDVTYFIPLHYPTRRIFTDGRKMPKDEPATFQGYSTGRWLDTDNDGTYDTLEVETVNFKGPRLYESSGIPLHDDNKSIVKERIFIDKDNPDILRNEITTIDNALTRPWTVEKGYVREREPKWIEYNCHEGNNHLLIAGEEFFMSGDGKLMPVKPGQAPPSLVNFTQATGK